MAEVSTVVDPALLRSGEAMVNPDRLIDLCSAMVNIASPPGEERELALHLATTLEDAGLGGQAQVVDGDLCNAWGRIPGRGPGAPLLLYAPIDTVTTGQASADLPWAGSELRRDMLPVATLDDGLVIGLGAHNPKGHGACIIAAAEVVLGLGIDLGRDLLVGFGGGGMPSNSRGPGLPDAHGAGCDALLELLAGESLMPAEAVIAKSGWAISTQEVGLAWYEVSVSGTHTYAGSRHLLPYRNAIADAGHIIGGLEQWFEQWAEETGDELHSPQGVVSAIEGGWPHMPAFTTALCRFWVDLRLHPETTPEEADEAFGSELTRLANQVGAKVSWRRTIAVPGSSTSLHEPIVQTCVTAWQDITGSVHQPIPRLSGATDANILRGAGIPTARVGLPKVQRDDLDVDFAFGMNAVDVGDMVRLTRLLIRVILNRCGVVERQKSAT